MLFHDLAPAIVVRHTQHAVPLALEHVAYRPVAIRFEIVMVKRSLEAAKAIIAGNSGLQWPVTAFPQSRCERLTAMST